MRTLNIGPVFGFGQGAAEAEAAATAAAEDGLVIGFLTMMMLRTVIDSMSARHGAELRVLRYDAVHGSDPTTQRTQRSRPKPLRGPGWRTAFTARS